MTPEMRQRLLGVYFELSAKPSCSGIPVYPEKITLPEYSPYDLWFLDSCGVKP